VWKYVYGTLNVLLTFHFHNRLMIFNKINNCFNLLINLEMWQPFIPLFLKIFASFMFRRVEKVLVYQHIINVSIKFQCISDMWLIIINNYWKMSNCILGVKFSYVRFISQVWKYVYDTLNVLFTSHLDYGFFTKLTIVLPDL